MDLGPCKFSYLLQFSLFRYSSIFSQKIPWQTTSDSNCERSRGTINDFNRILFPCYAFSYRHADILIFSIRKLPFLDLRYLLYS